MHEQFRTDTYAELLSQWEQDGSIGPEPGWPASSALGHTHPHDHGICIDPWSVDGAMDGYTFADTLQHELAHAIAGDFGHGDDWLEMCDVIGYEPSEEEKRSGAREGGDVVGDPSGEPDDGLPGPDTSQCPACGAPATEWVGVAPWHLDLVAEAMAIFGDEVEPIGSHVPARLEA